VGEAQRLTDVGLTEWQLNGLARLIRKAAADPDVDLQEQRWDPLPGFSRTDVGEMIIRTRLISGDLAAEQHGESRYWVM